MLLRSPNITGVIIKLYSFVYYPYLSSYVWSNYWSMKTPTEMSLIGVWPELQHLNGLRELRKQLSLPDVIQC